MRNGFRSSRGAMRGISGGTAGLATVAMDFRSFPQRLGVVTRIDRVVDSHCTNPCTWPDNKTCSGGTSSLHSEPTTRNRPGRKNLWRDPLRLTIGGKLVGDAVDARILVAAHRRAKVQGLRAFAQWNRKHFRHVKSADRVA